MTTPFPATAPLRRLGARVPAMLALGLAALLVCACGGGQGPAAAEQQLAALVADMNRQAPVPMEGMTLEGMTLEADAVIYDYSVANAEILYFIRDDGGGLRDAMVASLLRAPDSRAFVQLAVACDRGVGFRYACAAEADTFRLVYDVADLRRRLETK